MKKFPFYRVLRTAPGLAAAAVIIALVMSAPLAGQTAGGDRFLDAAPARDAGVRLAVFNPEVFNIRALATLRENGVFNVPGLTVVGVYHERQTGRFDDSRTYVRENGLDWFKFHEIRAEISEPVLFKRNACTPEFELIVEKADGVIFFGGPDIPPAVFGEKTLLLTDISDPFRHYLECSAVFHLLGGSQDETFEPLLGGRPDFAVLGICLGFQTIVVGTGGTLVQDIWTETYGQTTAEDVIALGPEQWHNNPYRVLFPLDRLMGYNFHSLQLGDNGLFVKDLGFKASDHPRILSSHHQALEKMGRGLVAIASSRDGKIIEAVGHKTYAGVLGVQFHPEHPLLFDAEPRHRQKPGDPPTSYLAILEGTPPSVAFNEAVWSWFAGRLIESHGR
ncbi:MAG: gamma-glutamyl-gamma-aminobutyrate hydrolase family protein [Candidatus Aminicenantes bacterium]|nr:gamma-glutamyl-gamma-aminobutyrate hydrolase family protein [Candidatus Aminicenantes bacterium]